MSQIASDIERAARDGRETVTELEETYERRGTLRSSGTGHQHEGWVGGIDVRG